jgi:hypothetical protein
MEHIQEAPKEIAMEGIQDYCDRLATELGAWKAKANDVVMRMDHVSSGDKEKVMDQVRDLHMFVEELENRIIGLSTECPTHYEQGQIEMEAKLTEKYIDY